jgi:purine-binding chemotaxis protein CheW
MTSIDQHEKRFASFSLDGAKSIEVAIRAEMVLEATPITGAIQPLPASVAYLEGFMHLRDDAIPVINMKKRLGLPITDYTVDAKVAVVDIFHIRFGLLFDDIKDVIMVDSSAVFPVPPALQTTESIISDLIKLNNGQRTMELLDLKRLFGNADLIEQIQEVIPNLDRPGGAVQQTLSRYVVFSSLDQEYGVPVEQVQEITFLSEVDDVFKNDSIEGAVQLRGHPIPVLSAARLLQTQSENPTSGDDTRVLVLNADTFQYGLIVDSIREIISIPDQAILPLPRNDHGTITGVYQRPDGKNIMLIQIDTLIQAQQRELRSVARLKSNREEEHVAKEHMQSRHLITADCYLVFSIGRNFAIELNDVQEIIESKDLMELPAATGFDRRVLNLRGTIVPVVNLRAFYGYEDNDASPDKKLIIAKDHSNVIAFEVDRIQTIYKQVQYQHTPSLNPQLNSKKDTLDRLIEFVGDTGVKEHVLVINVKAIMGNHLGMLAPENIASNEVIAKEKDNHGNITSQ